MLYAGMIVIVDTNVLRADFLFKSERHALFLNACKRTKTTLLVPQIVLEEANHLFEIEKKKRKKEMVNSFNLFSRLCLVAPPEPELFKISEETLTYSNILEQLFCSCSDYQGFDTIPYKESFLTELAKRAVSKIKPFSQSGQEFRDALLWLSIVDFIKLHDYKNIDEDFAFITFNSKDFGDPNSKKLNESLRKELDANNLKLDVFFSIEEFMVKYMNYTVPFTDEWLSSCLNWNKLNIELEKAVNGIHCSFYFTLFEGCCSEDLDNYEVASIECTDVEYHVSPEGDKTFDLELHFSGNVLIDFQTDSGKIIRIGTCFGTQTTAKATSDGVFYYSDEYFEEESGIALEPFTQQELPITVMEPH